MLMSSCRCGACKGKAGQAGLRALPGGGGILADFCHSCCPPRGLSSPPLTGLRCQKGHPPQSLTLRPRGGMLLNPYAQGVHGPREGFHFRQGSLSVQTSMPLTDLLQASPRASEMRHVGLAGALPLLPSSHSRLTWVPTLPAAPVRFHIRDDTLSDVWKSAP